MERKIRQIFNEKLAAQKTKEPKAIGQTNINQLLAMYRSQARYGASLGGFLSRMHKAFPEWNIAPNHVALFAYIKERCGDYSED